jgi:hypothetical protein
MERMTEAEKEKAAKERAVEFLTKRIGDTLSIYAAAIVIDEEDPDFGISMIPVDVDVNHGELEVHYKDTLDPELPDTILTVRIEANE